MFNNNIKENPQCSKHQGKQRKTCGNCSACDNNSRCIREYQALYAFNGRMVAGLWGDLIIKNVKSSIHMLRKPKGWACDKKAIDQGIELGAKFIEIHDKESGDIYKSSLDNFIENGQEIDRGYGAQIVLPLQYWDPIISNIDTGE